MRDIDKALAEIGEIRCQIASNTAFRGYGPVAITITGILALITATAQSLMPIAGTPFLYCLEWMGTAAICGAVVRIEMEGRTQRLHSGLADTMIHQAIEQFMPTTVASFFMPLLLVQFAPQNVWMMPGLWQILVSLGIYASLHTLPRTMFYAGAFYLISGFASLLFASQSHALSPWLMGAPFLIGQSLMAAILYYAAGGSHGED